MIQAKRNNELILAKDSGEIATCPHCYQEVKAYCGSILINHWKHIYKGDCIYNNSGESEWHLNLKMLFYNAGCCIERKIGYNIYDVILDNGYTVEIQNSSISQEECVSRNNNNNNKIIWIYNCNEQFEREQLFFDKNFYTYYQPKSCFFVTDIMFFEVAGFFYEIKFKKYEKGFYKNRAVNYITGYYFKYDFKEFFNTINNYKK